MHGDKSTNKNPNLQGNNGKSEENVGNEGKDKEKISRRWGTRQQRRTKKHRNIWKLEI